MCFQMPLEITRSFVENRDGTYDLYEAPKVAVENMDDAFKTKNQTPIRPFELKTFLKVGQCSWLVSNTLWGKGQGGVCCSYTYAHAHTSS